MRTATLRLLPLLALLAAPAVAQEHQHPGGAQQPAPTMGMMGMMGGMGDGAMEGMAGSPAMILRLREPLGLTPQQVQRLEGIQGRTHPGHEQHMMAAQTAMRDAAAMLEGDAPDLARYEARLREAADHCAQAHVAEARAAIEARAVLTPEQRSNLRFASRMMQQMMQGQPQGQMQGMMAPQPSRP